MNFKISKISRKQWKIVTLFFMTMILTNLSSIIEKKASSQENFSPSLRRAQYLLSGSFPGDSTYQKYGQNIEAYKQGVRNFINSDSFYDVTLRYHEKLLGIGLPDTYIEELQREEIDGKNLKIARLSCSRKNSKLSCQWKPGERKNLSNVGQCPSSWLEPVAPFWQPSTRLWVCPSVSQTCGSNLSQCFIVFEDESEARNTELGTSEAFDTRLTVTKSLSRQAAGLAAAVVTENYPYTTILKPGVTAIDAALAHLINQSHHFDLQKLHIPESLKSIIKNREFGDSKFKLVYTGESSELGGILSTFGFLRRYEKNRTRANQVYERLLCRKFTSEPPKVFPQDPGNLRTTPGCSGCHETLDPLSDFFSPWGEAGGLYDSQHKGVDGSFIGKSGYGVASLSDIISKDDAFATCTVQNVWKWLVGREFYKDEEGIREVLTSYLVSSKYSFKELVYAIATHPTFVRPARGDSAVSDPLEQPPLGKVPETSNKKECKPNVTYAEDIAPKIGICTACHKSEGARQSLQTEADWKALGKTSVGLLASGSMPPGLTGPPLSGPIWELKEAVRCWVEQNP